MKDIGVVVMLSDNLVNHRFVEECQFLRLGSVEAAYLSTWRFMLRRSSCLVCSLPDDWEGLADARRWKNQVRSECASALLRTGPFRPQDIHLVLVASAQIFDGLVQGGQPLRDRSPFHFNRIVGTLVVDRERMRVAELPPEAGSAAGCLAQVANHLNGWCRMNLRLKQVRA